MTTKAEVPAIPEIMTNEAKVPELLCCPNPWCKKSAPVVKRLELSSSVHVEYIVVCITCRIGTNGNSTYGEAITTWNTRVDDVSNPQRHQFPPGTCMDVDNGYVCKEQKGHAGQHVGASDTTVHCWESRVARLTAQETKERTHTVPRLAGLRARAQWALENDEAVSTHPVNILNMIDEISTLEADRGACVEALKKIATDPDCGCEDHANEDCCIQSGVFCAGCIARAALARFESGAK